MKTATTDDIAFLASCFANLALHLKGTSQALYVRELPSEVDDRAMAMAARFVEAQDATAFIEDADGYRAGAILCEIRPSAFPPSGLGNVGHISACWVEPQYRKAGVASRLVAAAEHWFAEQGVSCVELSYLAGNELAAQSWKKLGYEPFRIFSFKQLERCFETGVSR